MKAGKLKHRIVFKRASEITDEFGDQVTNWSAIATIWADVLVLSGKEIHDDNQITAELIYKVRYRPRTDLKIKASDVVFWNDKTLEITHPPFDPYGRGDELNLLCKELIND